MPSGRYGIVRKLGEGGMGRTYLVRDRKLGKYWAMKEWKEAEEGEESFWRECAVLRNLDHSCFPRIVEIFRENGKRYLVMDWIQGVSLEEEIIRHGSIPASVAVQYAIQLCGALTLLHEGEPKILHLDLKPSNIILTQEGVKLIDFGSALQTGASVRKAEYDRERQAGTPGYVPPELLSGGTKEADERSDVYGLGAVLYAMLMGKNPGEGKESGDRQKTGGRSCGRRPKEPALPAGLKRILTRALQEKKEDRFASVEEMRLELQRALERENRRRRRKRARLSFFPAVLGAACIALALFAVKPEEAQREADGRSGWNDSETDIGRPVVRQEKKARKNRRFIHRTAQIDTLGSLPYEGLLENFRKRIEGEANDESNISGYRWCAEFKQLG